MNTPPEVAQRRERFKIGWSTQSGIAIAAFAIFGVWTAVLGAENYDRAKKAERRGDEFVSVLRYGRYAARHPEVPLQKAYFTARVELTLALTFFVSAIGIWRMDVSRTKKKKVGPT